MFIVHKEDGFLKFVKWIFQMIMLEKMQQILPNLQTNIAIRENLVNSVMDHFITNVISTSKLMIWKQVHDNTWFSIFVSYL